MNFDISNIGTWAGSLSLVAWVVYIVFKCFIQESMKSKFDKELEGFKAGYKKVLDENQIRFSKWHDTQADAIKELYQKLTELKISLRHMVNPYKITTEGQDPKEEREKGEKRFVAAYESSHRFYEANKILLAEKHICKLEKLYKEVISSIRFHGKSKNAKGSASCQHADKAHDFAKSTESILDDLRKDFRAILNGEEVQNAE